MDTTCDFSPLVIEMEKQRGKSTVQYDALKMSDYKTDDVIAVLMGVNPTIRQKPTKQNYSQNLKKFSNSNFSQFT